MTKKQIPNSFTLSSETSHALQNNLPVVAFESAVITHGLLFPDNLNLTRECQQLVQSKGVCPSAMALIDGKVCVGLEDDQLEFISKVATPLKVSTRNIGLAIAQKRSGGTTVAATLAIARLLGIYVFSTGGIGGVHRVMPFDISNDLDELAKSPVIVVCSGAKAILDLHATFEALETRGVPVLGYQTDEVPAFYSRESGIPVDLRVDSPDQVVQIALRQWEVGLTSAILICQPPPETSSIARDEIDEIINQAVDEAKTQHVYGSKTTPFLLNRVMELTCGKSLQTNLSLLKNNAVLAAKIALVLSSVQSKPNRN